MLCFTQPSSYSSAGQPNPSWIPCHDQKTAWACHIASSPYTNRSARTPEPPLQQVIKGATYGCFSIASQSNVYQSWDETIECMKAHRAGEIEQHGRLSHARLGSNNGMNQSNKSALVTTGSNDSLAMSQIALIIAVSAKP